MMSEFEKLDADNGFLSSDLWETFVNCASCHRESMACMRLCFITLNLQVNTFFSVMAMRTVMNHNETVFGTGIRRKSLARTTTGTSSIITD